MGVLVPPKDPSLFPGSTKSILTWGGPMSPQSSGINYAQNVVWLCGFFLHVARHTVFITE